MKGFNFLKNIFKIRLMNSFEGDLDLESESTTINLEEIRLLREKREKKIYCIKFMVIFCFVVTFGSILLLFISTFFQPSEYPTKVIYWNLQDFGTTKLNNPTKMNGINRILSNYDIILLSELEQSDCDTNDLCEMKVYFQQTYPDYHFYMSPSLGRGQDNRGKEQYGFLVNKKFTFQIGSYSDPNQIFARRPYYIYISELKLYFANVHITASSLLESKKEVSELYNFFEEIQGNMILMGDLNLCNPSVLNGEKVREDLNWILDDSVMTNLDNVNQRCAYDRIITDKNFNKYKNPNVIQDSDIINLALSDHYPVSIHIL